MPILDAILVHVPAFALVLARLSGLFIFAPLISSVAMQARFKVLLTLALALVIYPTIDHAGAPARLDFFELGPLMAAELLIGAGIGIVAAVPLMTAQLAGVIMGQQMGLGLASVLNPTVDIEGDSLGQMLFFAALAAFLSCGGMETLFDTLVRTFGRVPLGGFPLAAAPLELLVGVVGSSFEVILRVALPVLAILLLENVAVGFIMKSVPSLNISSFGFPVRILLGLLVVVSGLAVMIDVTLSEMATQLEAVRAWVGSL